MLGTRERDAAARRDDMRRERLQQVSLCGVSLSRAHQVREQESSLSRSRTQAYRHARHQAIRDLVRQIQVKKDATSSTPTDPVDHAGEGPEASM